MFPIMGRKVKSTNFSIQICLGDQIKSLCLRTNLMKFKLAALTCGSWTIKQDKGLWLFCNYPSFLMALKHLEAKSIQLKCWRKAKWSCYIRNHFSICYVKYKTDIIHLCFPLISVFLQTTVLFLSIQTAKASWRFMKIQVKML